MQISTFMRASHAQSIAQLTGGLSERWAEPSMRCLKPVTELTQGLLSCS